MTTACSTPVTIASRTRYRSVRNALSRSGLDAPGRSLREVGTGRKRQAEHVRKLGIEEAAALARGAVGRGPAELDRRVGGAVFFVVEAPVVEVFGVDYVGVGKLVDRAG